MPGKAAGALLSQKPCWLGNPIDRLLGQSGVLMWGLITVIVGTGESMSSNPPPGAIPAAVTEAVGRFGTAFFVLLYPGTVLRWLGGLRGAVPPAQGAKEGRITDEEPKSASEPSDVSPEDFRQD